MKRFMDKVSHKLLDMWIRFRQKRKERIFPYRLEQEMKSLEPGKDTEIILYDYYRNKVKMVLWIFLFGILLMCCYVISRIVSGSMQETEMLKRNDYGEGEKVISMDAVVEEEIYSLDVTVSQKQPKKEEAEDMILEVMEKIPEIIMGENESLSHVDHPLNLITSMQNYPVSICWESDNYTVIREDGTFGEEEPEQNGESVTLRAILTYGEIQREKEFEICVYPQIYSKEEEIIRELKKEIMLKAQQTKQEEYLSLPATVNGKSILWKHHEQTVLPLLGLLLVFTVIGVFIGKDKEVHKRFEERNKALLSEYAEFVSKLQLLISSGMSMRRAVEKMTVDYRKNRKEGGRKKIVYEELQFIHKKMESGLSETEAFDLFGNRCGLVCYKKFSTLIIQNLKKGSDGLLCALSNEMKLSFEEHKQAARGKGEEAGTKLLLPMMMMMGIVLVIIMIPAFFSFGVM